jgi:hypothetical protein
MRDIMDTGISNDDGRNSNKKEGSGGEISSSTVANEEISKFETFNEEEQEAILAHVIHYTCSTMKIT